MDSKNFNSMNKVNIENLVNHIPLSDQEKDASLSYPIQKLKNFMNKNEMVQLAHSMKKNSNKIWMINSTATGGGVAEMMPRLMYTLREFDFPIEWLVINTQEKPFFNLTKKIHNFIHGKNPANVSLSFDEENRKLFERINEENFFSAFNEKEIENSIFNLKKGDIVVVHDPQPSPLILFIRKFFTSEEIPCIWRCHIGLDFETPETKTVWKFLEKYITLYDCSIFSAKEYIPECLNFKLKTDEEKFDGKNLSFFVSGSKSVIIHPSIHPFDAKNKHLSFFETKKILSQSGMTKPMNGVLQFPWLMTLLQPNGKFISPFSEQSMDFKWLERPIITEISRWDRLKGWIQLMEAFVEMKKKKKEILSNSTNASDKTLLNYYLENTGLVLCGPAPEFVADDPEGKEVLDEVCNYYLNLPIEIKKDVAILCLPCNDRKQNALMVNAIQNISEIMVQNSIREGFGLTLTESMWKQKPCIASTACGLKQQMRSMVDGFFINDASNPEDVLNTLIKMFEISPEIREEIATNAKKRVVDNFLVYTQAQKYVDLFYSFQKKNHSK